MKFRKKEETKHQDIKKILKNIYMYQRIRWQKFHEKQLFYLPPQAVDNYHLKTKGRDFLRERSLGKILSTCQIQTIKCNMMKEHRL